MKNPSIAGIIINKDNKTFISQSLVQTSPMLFIRWASICLLHDLLTMLLFCRLRLCKDGSHWLDTLSVSNSSSRNWNSWFVATIASLNTVVKTFAKIAKTFAGLLTTSIATRRRPILILHLEAKYAKIDCKNEIYVKNWVRSSWTAKVNSGKKSTVKVNPQSKSTQVNGLVNVLVNDDVSWLASDVSRWCGSDDVT